MTSAVATSTASEVALGRLSGSLPTELGAWALRTSGAASGAFLMAFWPSDLGDGTLYSDEQLKAMSRAATRVRFRFIEDEQGRMQVYGIHTSAASGMDSVPIVQARQEGSAIVAAIPGGPTLTWYPDSSGEVPDASSYYPERDGLEVSNILVRPIPDAPDAELETFPATGDDLEDCIITFPASLGIPPLYLVFSKPPVKLLEVDLFRNFEGRPRNGTHADHMPSQAAIEAYLKSLDSDMDQDLIKSYKKDVASIIIPASVHQKYSETYGRRNTRNDRAQIIKDSSDLRKAVDNNFDAIKPYLRDEGFSDTELEQAREKMHKINKSQGWY
ncbi:S-type pyocin domain-containing protein [Aeromonas dhakensis]|uniref:S-type pyocin domain-containing protein n=1 Tax=Aeromonas dhakensis TaxID=196024 RepID=UPI0038CF81A8